MANAIALLMLINHDSCMRFDPYFSPLITEESFWNVLLKRLTNKLKY